MGYYPSLDRPPEWGDSFELLSDERKHELRDRLLSWSPDHAIETQPGPFAGERLDALEVFWLAACWHTRASGAPADYAKQFVDRKRSRFPLSLTPTMLVVLADPKLKDLSGLNLSGANLSWMRLTGADLTGADLTGADLEGAHLSRALLWRANLQQADLSRADLREASLLYADLRRSDMRLANLQQVDLSRADLREADLWHADLREANLSEANLSQAKLPEANLLLANLTATNLAEANASKVNLARANLVDANLAQARLTASDLSEARLIRTTLSHANMTGCRVYGASVWNVTLDGAVQTNLRITPPGEAEITIDNLEVAQFLYLMLHNEKIRQVIDTITGKVVLILGRFSPNRKQILDVLREALRAHGYVPVLFDFNGPINVSTTETVTLLARMARFVLADLTEPGSVPYELAKIVPDAHVPVQPLLLDGTTTFSMAKDLWQLHPHLMLPLYRYTTLDELLAILPDRIIAPAEARAAELQRLRNLPVDGLP